jgi:glycerol-3-phosphate dehydrogenase subunit B
MKRFDLIVIGTGLAGLTAARTAVEMGAKVMIAGRGMGALTLFGNTIDLLGEIAPGTDMAEGIAPWIAAHPKHPYARTGPGGIESALAGFQALFPPPYSFASEGSGNSLLPTGAGTMRPTYLIPATMAAGAAMTPAGTLIVNFRGFKDFQGDTVSLHLKCRGVNLSLPRYGLERHPSGNVSARRSCGRWQESGSSASPRSWVSGTPQRFSKRWR